MDQGNKKTKTKTKTKKKEAKNQACIELIFTYKHIVALEGKCQGLKLKHFSNRPF